MIQINISGKQWLSDFQIDHRVLKLQHSKLNVRRICILISVTYLYFSASYWLYFWMSVLSESDTDHTVCQNHPTTPSITKQHPPTPSITQYRPASPSIAYQPLGITQLSQVSIRWTSGEHQVSIRSTQPSPVQQIGSNPSPSFSTVLKKQNLTLLFIEEWT